MARTTVALGLRLLAGLTAGLAGVISTLAGASPARAEFEIGLYGGANTSLSSRVEMHSGGLSDVRTVDWEGVSFTMPPYWGIRGIWWLNRSSNWGLGIDYMHSKARADIDFATDPVYKRLEFTNGNNLLMLNVMYRFAPWMDDRLTPYVGIGGGIAVPHVEVRLKPPYPTDWTGEYQFAGGAAQALVGLDFRVTGGWSIFTEAKISYSHLATELEAGGQLKTYLWTPQIMLGVTYRFGE
jgi:lipid A oxidase